MTAPSPLLALLLALCAQACAAVPLPALGIGVRVQSAGQARDARLQLTLDFRPRSEPLDRLDAVDDVAASGTAGTPSVPVDPALAAWEVQARSDALHAMAIHTGVAP